MLEQELGRELRALDQSVTHDCVQSVSLRHRLLHQAPALEWLERLRDVAVDLCQLSQRGEVDVVALDVREHPQNAFAVRTEPLPRPVHLASDLWQVVFVLDNHEDDRAMARLLDCFARAPVTFVITARRCLLAGVLIFPVTAPLVTAGRSAFPRVARLTRMLRWNPLALDIADGIVGSRAASVPALTAFLEQRGVQRVRAVEHEDDLPEIALLVDWAWRRLTAASRRILGVLAHIEGDHVDLASLATLAKIRGPLDVALEPLLSFRLVQEPVSDRYTLHAVVRHAVVRRTALSPELVFEHYVSLLEAQPERLNLEQTHLFAAMDHAHRTSNLNAMLRVEALSRRLAGLDD